MRFNLLTLHRWVQLFLGLILFGIGMGLMLKGAVGVTPWDVLGQGISMVSGISFGTVTVIIGAIILLLWIPIKQKPGIGTVLNVLILGPVAQFVIDVLPYNDSIIVRILLCAAGIVIIALGTGLYIGAGFGPGPRDGLMTGIHKQTGWPIWIVRSGLEVSVLIIGWLLGGNVGLGTLAFALLIGPLAQPAMKWFDLRDRIAAQAT